MFVRPEPPSTPADHRATLRRALAIIAQHHAVGKHAGSPCTDCGEEGPCEYVAWWAEASASVGGVSE